MRKVKINLPRLQSIELSAYDPTTRRVRALMLLLAFAIVSWLFYWMGSEGYRLPVMTENIEMADIRSDLKTADKDNRDLRREVARLQRSTQIDVQAAEQIKKTLYEKELKY